MTYKLLLKLIDKCSILGLNIAFLMIRVHGPPELFHISFIFPRSVMPPMIHILFSYTAEEWVDLPSLSKIYIDFDQYSPYIEYYKSFV